LESDDTICIKQKNPSVLILPYTLDQYGNPNELGIISKDSSFKDGATIKCLISDSPSEEDSDILQTAKRALLDNTGFSVEDLNKWDFLGSIMTSTLIINGNPAFSVDITGLVTAESSGTSKIDFSLYTVRKVLEFDDAVISCLFLKTFQNKFVK